MDGRWGDACTLTRESVVLGGLPCGDGTCKPAADSLDLAHHDSCAAPYALHIPEQAAASPARARQRGAAEPTSHSTTPDLAQAAASGGHTTISPLRVRMLLAPPALHASPSLHSTQPAAELRRDDVNGVGLLTLLTQLFYHRPHPHAAHAKAAHPAHVIAEGRVHLQRLFPLQHAGAGLRSAKGHRVAGLGQPSGAGGAHLEIVALAIASAVAGQQGGQPCIERI